ncbi:MAG: hypothetical protein ACK5XS_12225 [Armatimonadota bacterium]|jgi:translation elongation factor EF-Tu-like GTPase
MPTQEPNEGGVYSHFIGSLRFLSEEEGGRINPPFQGYFPQFKYKNQVELSDWLVKPWFFDQSGQYYERGDLVPLEVSASFYILDPELRVSVHQKICQVGVEFVLREGSRITAHGVVTKVTGLFDPE